MKSLAPLAAALLCAFPAAHAATFTVTSLADAGAGSLRAANAAANAASGADTITFQTGLTGTITLASGELRVSDSLTIAGPGANRITIDGNDASRVFHIDDNGPDDRAFTFSGLAVTGGRAVAANDDQGGGLYLAPSFDQVPLRLTNMVFTANHAARRGGAISVSGSQLTLVNVHLTGNTVEGGFQPSGGALYADRTALVMERCRVVDNDAQLSGGGISMSSPGISAAISDTLVQGNTATHTGAGMNVGTMSQLTIRRSAFVDNWLTSQTEGGAIYFAGVTDAGSPENVIENSTFSGNISQHDSGRGSALAIASGNMIVRNSTFAHNRTSPDAAGTPNAGGALWVANGTSSRVTVQSTLFADNTHGNASTPRDLTRLTGGGGESTLSVDHSLFEVLPAIGVITNPGSGNFEADAQLLPLAYAGGATPVHALPLASPAVDAGANPANLTTEQRGPGFARAMDANPCRRPLVARADIGAYEYRSDTIFCYGFNN
ncbi:MAG TPA: right-handed parallel beta-helix repeat-containing protein [Dokdonella sp.]